MTENSLKLNILTDLIGNKTEDINSFFRNWQNHSESTRLAAIRALRASGHLSPKMKIDRIETNFKCPLHNFVLIKPCGLTSCPFHITGSHQNELTISCKNCLINGLDVSKNTRLSAVEVASLLGTSISEINVSNSTAISKIRKAKIKEQIERYQIPKFRYITGHCITCEQYILDEIEMNIYPDLVLQAGDFGWCSNKCKESKAKWQFNIERDFECDYLDVLAIGLLMYKSIESLNGIFNIHKDILLKHKEDIEKKLDELKSFFL